ncbi:UDP-galactopyranose mutase [Thermoproteota archaeon]
MKVLVVGSGLSGCTISRILKDDGHDVTLIEKKDCIGGLCITKLNQDGLKYEPFGARIFHTKSDKIKSFVTRFNDFSSYIHRKGMIINGKMFPFPITKGAIEGFSEKDKILNELEGRPAKIDETNFETACISIFGKTLYSYFISNYTFKMWGMAPANLNSDWVPKRLELANDENDTIFMHQWQGFPRDGYSVFLGKMTKDIPVELNKTEFDPNGYDIVVFTGPLDKKMNLKFGKLEYRSIKFTHKRDDPWENDNYGTINLPQDPKWIRKCNFKVMWDKNAKHNWIQYQEPVAADDDNIEMYPMDTKKNNDIFDRYLLKICETNILPAGRLGLFKYLDMDKAVEASFDTVALIENYSSLSPEKRYDSIQKMRVKY